MHTDTMTLIDILAAQDALWTPCRDMAGWQTVYERRRLYGSCGVLWRSGGDEANRQAARRQLGDLTDAGLVAVHRPKGDKVLGASLTLAGEQQARGLAGLPGFADALRTVAELADLTDHPDSTAGGAFVPEPLLIDEPTDWRTANRDDVQGLLLATEEMLLPALARGWAVSLATMRRQVWYAVGNVEPDADAIAALPDPPARDTETRRRYYDQLKAALARWPSIPPTRPGELGAIPMPVAVPRKGMMA